MNAVLLMTFYGWQVPYQIAFGGRNQFRLLYQLPTCKVNWSYEKHGIKTEKGPCIPASGTEDRIAIGANNNK